MKDQTKIIAALLVGAAAGAAIGLLFTTDKGGAIRGEVADYINDLVEKSKEKAQKTADELRGYGGNVVDRAKSKINGVVGNLSDYKDQIRDSIKASASDYTDKATEFGEDLLNNAKAKARNVVSDVNNNVQGG
jgi:gas vesicle protein